MNWRFLVPNFFTTISFGFGFSSILATMMGAQRQAAWFILWCVLLDKVDGTAARLLKATSRFGSEFDSFADVVAFGLAPAILVFETFRNISSKGWEIDPAGNLILLVSVGLYALFATMRLARFNSIEHAPGERHFSGIPTTLCGAIVASSILVLEKYQLLTFEWIRFYPIGIALLGLGMVAHLPIPKLLPRKNLFMNIFQVANIVAAYLCGILCIFPEYLLSLAAVYVLVGTAVGFIQLRSIMASNPSPAASSDEAKQHETGS